MHGYNSPSKLDQYRKLKRKALAGKLGARSQQGCVYAHGGRNCAIGALFTQAQIKDIKECGLNHFSIQCVSETIGRKNLEAVTGFTLKELTVMQHLHDASASLLITSPQTTYFVDWLNRQIAKEGAKNA